MAIENISDTARWVTAYRAMETERGTGQELICLRQDLIKIASYPLGDLLLALC